jgi:nitroreductase|tara:strand:- start:285 stop:1058 length:774 start_codon:yes stop_codon:yes gene_type:complete
MVKVKIFETPKDSDRPAVDSPQTDAKAFHNIINSRRSVRFFSSDDIPQDVIDQCLDAALLAPNSSNLQTWEIHHVVDSEKKKTLVEFCLSQPAASTAKELFVFVSRPDMWKRNNQWMIDEFDRRGNMPEKAYQYFRNITKMVYTTGVFGIAAPFKWLFFNIRGIFQPTPREPIGRWGMKIWGHKSTSLACAHFMLAMRAHGFDTCPMEGFDSRRVKRLLGLPRRAQITMVISAGKRAKGGIYGDRFRFDQEKVVIRH